MQIEDIIFEELKSDTVYIDNLNEGIIPLNSILAFLTLKKNALNSLKKISGKSDSTIFDKDYLNKQVLNLKANAIIGKEKLRHDLMVKGYKDDDTVYKFTKEQLNVLADLREKYGDKIIDEVLEFRKNVLAPYQVIKRLVKTNKIVSSKEKFGMTYAQYKNAVVSGLNKIEKRKTFLEDNKNLENEIKDIDIAIESLRELRKSFINSGILKDTIVNKVLKYYNLGSSEFDNSLDVLRNTYDELKRNSKELQKYLENPAILNPILAQNTVLRNIELRKGIIKKELKDKENSNIVKEDINDNESLADSPVFYKNNNFNIELGKYMLRREIINDLKKTNFNIYKKTYLDIINNLIDKAIERRKELIDKKIKLLSSIEFNEIERKIFKQKPYIKTKYSGNIDDYVQVVKDEDFSNPEYIKKPKELIKAEKDIEAEIKRFERKLQTVISKEDFEKLKKYRLINNLITVSELKNPNELFKSPDEIKLNLTKKNNKENKEDNEENNSDETKTNNGE